MRDLGSWASNVFNRWRIGQHGLETATTAGTCAFGKGRKGGESQAAAFGKAESMAGSRGQAGVHKQSGCE